MKKPANEDRLLSILGRSILRTTGQVKHSFSFAQVQHQIASLERPTEKTAIQRQIDATDRQIDRLVYELNELTEEEIRMVEDATRLNC